MNKSDNLDEMNKFPERSQLSKLTKEEINMNRPAIHKRMNQSIKNFPQKRSLGPDGFTGKFYKMF